MFRKMSFKSIKYFCHYRGIIYKLKYSLSSALILQKFLSHVINLAESCDLLSRMSAEKITLPLILGLSMHDIYKR